MWRYLLRRLLLGGVTLIGVSFLVYGLLRNIPGEPLDAGLEAGDPNSFRMVLDEMRRELGLDRHWLVGYIDWAGGLLRGDLGRSLAPGRLPVADVILPRIGPTLLLSGSSLLLAYLLSIPLGIWCGVRAGTVRERAVSTTLYMLYSLPGFVAALYLLIFFSLRLDWLPLSGMRSPAEEYARLPAAEKVLDLLRHMVLPVACLTYGSLAYHVRFIRANLTEALRQDYIRTARAKGLGEWTVAVRHAFRNSLIPLVTHIGMAFPALLSGSVIIERIFNWPGIGSLLFEKVNYRDYPVIMALVLLFSLLVFLGNLAADLLYPIVDPRVRTAR